MRGVFVTGTDTGVGKSVLSAAIAAALKSRGEDVAASKPVLTGTEETPGLWPPDDVLLATATGQEPDEVTALRFGPPVSPHLAAEQAGVALELDALLPRARAEVLVVEGVGGLLVPLGARATVRDLAAAIGLPVVVAARPGLGTINHTLLTLEAARTAGLDVRGVVMTPWPGHSDPMAESNQRTVELIGNVPVTTLPAIAGDDLAEAGSQLPLDDWLHRDEGDHAA